MKRSSKNTNDGGRRRCVQCGHPLREHHAGYGCSVPKCSCKDYVGASVPDDERA